MQTASLPSDAASAASFKIVILYENLAAGLRAQEMAERLSKQMNVDTEMAVDLWKFDLFEYPSMQDRAAHDAVDADMIVISADAHGKLPSHVRDWLEHVFPASQQADMNCALVALLGNGSHARVTWEVENVRHYLQEVADRGGMDFFCKNDSLATEPDGITQPKDLASNTLVFLEESFTPDVGWRRWGIND